MKRNKIKNNIIRIQNYKKKYNNINNQKIKQYKTQNNINNNKYKKKYNYINNNKMKKNYNKEMTIKYIILNRYNKISNG